MVKDSKFESLRKSKSSGKIWVVLKRTNSFGEGKILEQFISWRLSLQLVSWLLVSWLPSLGSSWLLASWLLFFSCRLLGMSAFFGVFLAAGFLAAGSLAAFSGVFLVAVFFFGVFGFLTQSFSRFIILLHRNVQFRTQLETTKNLVAGFLATGFFAASFLAAFFGVFFAACFFGACFFAAVFFGCWFLCCLLRCFLGIW